jgi:Phage integrase family
VRVLRSALGWAHAERVLDRHPLDGMRGPPQARIRQHAPVETVRAILDHAAHGVAAAVDVYDGTFNGRARLHRAEQLAADAGHPDVTLHRLRHTVATTLVSRGDILGAQHRLGHRDASTTLRIYAHALPLTDTDAADTVDRLYRSVGPSRSSGRLPGLRYDTLGAATRPTVWSGVFGIPEGLPLGGRCRASHVDGSVRLIIR